jgi:hypothetical protein
MLGRRANRNSACNTHSMKITRSARWAGIAVLGMFTFLAALLPAADAQIVPVSLKEAPEPDSRIPSGTVLAPLPPLPRSEPRRAVKTALPRSFFVLSAGVHTAAGLHMQQSESMLPHFDERDPIALPFFAAARAGLLRFGGFVCYGRKLFGMEDGAVGALA